MKNSSPSGGAKIVVIVLGSAVVGTLVGRAVGTVVRSDISSLWLIGDTLYDWSLALTAGSSHGTEGTRIDPVLALLHLLTGDDPVGILGAGIGFLVGFVGGAAFLLPILDRPEEASNRDSRVRTCPHEVSLRTPMYEDSENPRRITAVKCGQCGARIPPPGTR